MSKISIKITALYIAILEVILPGKPLLALSYSDFSQSVSSQIGQGSSLMVNLMVLAGTTLACIALYAAYKISAARQTKEVEKAMRRNQERRSRPPKAPTRLTRKSPGKR